MALHPRNLGTFRVFTIYDLLIQRYWTLGFQGAIFSNSPSNNQTSFLFGLTSKRYSRCFWGFRPFALAVSSREYTIILTSVTFVVSRNSQLRLPTVTERMESSLKLLFEMLQWPSSR